MWPKFCSAHSMDYAHLPVNFYAKRQDLNVTYLGKGANFATAPTASPCPSGGQASICQKRKEGGSKGEEQIFLQANFTTPDRPTEGTFPHISPTHFPLLRTREREGGEEMEIGRFFVRRPKLRDSHINPEPQKIRFASNGDVGFLHSSGKESKEEKKKRKHFSKAFRLS